MASFLPKRDVLTAPKPESSLATGTNATGTRATFEPTSQVASRLARLQAVPETREKGLRSQRFFQSGLDDETLSRFGLSRLKDPEPGLLQRGFGALAAVLEPLERPQQAILRGLGGAFGDTPDNPLSGFFGGLTGKGDRINTRQAFGIDANAGGRLAGLADTLGGIALDPLTYLTFGLSSLGKRAISEAAEAVGEEAAEQIARRGFRSVLKDPKSGISKEGLEKLSASPTFKRFGDLTDADNLKGLDVLDAHVRGGAKLQVPFKGNRASTLLSGETLRRPLRGQNIDLTQSRLGRLPVLKRLEPGSLIDPVRPAARRGPAVLSTPLGMGAEGPVRLGANVSPLRQGVRQSKLARSTRKNLSVLGNLRVSLGSTVSDQARDLAGAARSTAGAAEEVVERANSIIQNSTLDDVTKGRIVAAMEGSGTSGDTLDSLFEEFAGAPEGFLAAREVSDEAQRVVGRIKDDIDTIPLRAKGSRQKLEKAVEKRAKAVGERDKALARRDSARAARQGKERPRSKNPALVTGRKALTAANKRLKTARKDVKNLNRKFRGAQQRNAPPAELRSIANDIASARKTVDAAAVVQADADTAYKRILDISKNDPVLKALSATEAAADEALKPLEKALKDADNALLDAQGAVNPAKDEFDIAGLGGELEVAEQELQSAEDALAALGTAREPVDEQAARAIEAINDMQTQTRLIRTGQLDEVPGVKKQLPSVPKPDGTVPTPSLPGLGERVPRIVSPEAQAIIGDRTDVYSYIENAMPQGATLPERELLIKQRFPELKDVTVFEQDPVKFATVANVKAQTDLANAEYINGLIQVEDGAGGKIAYLGDAPSTGETAELGSTVVGAPSDYVPIKFMGQEMKVHPDLVPEIQRMKDSLFNPKNKTGLARNYDMVLNMWKGFATVPIPFGVAFHARNMMGNLYLNWLENIRPGAYITAKRLQGNVKKAVRATKKSSLLDNPLDEQGRLIRFADRKRLTFEDALKAEGVDGDDLKFILEARENGVLNAGFFNADLEGDNVAKAIRSGDKETALEWIKTQTSDPRRSFLIRNGSQIGRTIEDNARLAHYISKRNEGLSSLEASRSVKKSLFDYSELTTTEQNVMKRIVPFYCVPDSHEALTRDGFKHHSKLVIGEDIATFDPQTHEIQWEPLLEVATFDYDQEIWGYDRFQFTPNHRWPVERVHDGRRRMAEATEINSGEKLPLKGTLKSTEESLLTPRIATILGWLVTDGHYRYRGNHFEAVVYQSPKKHLEKLRALLGHKGYVPHPMSGVVAIPISPADKKVIREVFSNKEDMPGIVGRLSLEAAQAMWTAMFEAEGGTTPATGQRSWTQVEGPVLEAFQMLSTLIGESYRWKPRSDQNIAAGTMHKRDFLAPKGEWSKEHYTGTVWCPRTATGTWIMRHDGAVIPTGNTFMRKNTPVQIENIMKEPRRFLTSRRLQEGIIGSEETQETGAMPQWAINAGMIPLPKSVGKLLTGSDKGSALFGLELPTDAALEVVEPFLQMFAALPAFDRVLPDALDVDRQEFMSGLIGLPGGGITEVVKAGLEEATEKDLFTGAPIDIRSRRQTFERWAGIVPIASKGIGVLGGLFDRKMADDPETVSTALTILTAISGIKLTEVGPRRNRGEMFRRLDELNELIKDAQFAGIEVPTISELRKAGLVPDPPRKKPPVLGTEGFVTDTEF